MKSQSKIVGIGNYQLEMQWDERTYDSSGQAGNGLSEYYFFFDDGHGMPVSFPKAMLNLIGNVRDHYASNNKLTLVVNDSFRDGVFNIGAMEAHRGGYSYEPDAFKYNQDQAPFMFGEYDNGEFIQVHKIHMNLSPEQFAGEGDYRKHMIESIVIMIPKLADEHETAVIDVQYENVGYAIRVINSPDEGYIAGIVSGLDDFYYADEIAYGSSISDVIGQIMEPTINKIVKLMAILEADEE